MSLAAAHPFNDSLYSYEFYGIPSNTVNVLILIKTAPTLALEAPASLRANPYLPFSADCISMNTLKS